MNSLLQELIHTGGFIASEAPGTRSREVGLLASSQTSKPGMVLGKVLSGITPTGTAASGNTGNGTIGSLSTDGLAKGGTYNLVYIAAARFEVYDPTGALVGEGSNGVAFKAGGIGLTMTAGGTPFAAGDAFTIVVPVLDEQTIVTAAGQFGNQGAGTIALATPAALAGAQIGEYLATCNLATDGDTPGTFLVTDPEGNNVGTATMGSAFSTQLGFTITDSADIPFAAGDVILIDVSVVEAEGLLKQLNPSATDGSQIAAAVAYDGVSTGSGETKRQVYVARDAELVANALTWPAGITGAQVQAALDQLRTHGIIVRD